MAPFSLVSSCFFSFAPMTHPGQLACSILEENSTVIFFGSRRVSAQMANQKGKKKEILARVILNQSTHASLISDGSLLYPCADYWPCGDRKHKQRTQPAETTNQSQINESTQNQGRVSKFGSHKEDWWIKTKRIVRSMSKSTRKSTCHDLCRWSQKRSLFSSQNHKTLCYA